MCQGTNFTTVSKILDKVSTHPAMPPGLQGFKIGDCVESVIQVRDTYTKLAPKSDIDSIKQKRIILSSLAIIDSRVEKVGEKRDIDNINLMYLVTL